MGRMEKVVLRLKIMACRKWRFFKEDFPFQWGEICRFNSPIFQGKTCKHIIFPMGEPVAYQWIFRCVPPQSLATGTWKWWFPIGVSFSMGWFSGSMLVCQVCMVVLMRFGQEIWFFCCASFAKFAWKQLARSSINRCSMHWGALVRLDK